ncbi:MAG: MAPEG family protein [Phenylobacterium sp.]
MPIELRLLVYSTVLLLGLVIIQAIAGVRAKGVQAMADARDGLSPPQGFHARALRVVDNHREGLILFAPLILVAATTDALGTTTALGAKLFFYSRVGHAVIYLLGVPKIRPLFWIVGLIGTLMVLAAVLGLA